MRNTPSMTDVRTATPDDADQVGAIFAAGFGDDPVMTWVFEEPGRSAKLLALFRFLAAESHIPLGVTFLVPGSCAAWTPPGTPPWPDERGARLVTALAQVCTGGDLERLGVLDDATKAVHPIEPVWYLGVLATEPARRSRGGGTTLLTHALALVDADGLPAYLESTNPRNVSLYERHGFAATGTIALPGGPSLTAMSRPAR